MLLSQLVHTLDDLRSVLEQMQVEHAREWQHADEMEAMSSRRSDDELKRTNVGISQSGKGTGTANLAQLPAARWVWQGIAAEGPGDWWSDVTAEQTNQVKPFFQKAVAVVMIVDFMSIKDCKKWRDGGWVYAQDRSNKCAYFCSYRHMRSSTYENL